jgi:hypothetical protein
MWQKKVKPDFSYHYAGHVSQFAAALIKCDFFILNVDFIFVEIFYKKTLLINVPENYCVLLA